MPNLTIELPSQEEQMTFNLRRWSELIEDETWRRLRDGWRLIDTDTFS